MRRSVARGSGWTIWKTTLVPLTRAPGAESVPTQGIPAKFFGDRRA